MKKFTFFYIFLIFIFFSNTLFSEGNKIIFGKANVIDGDTIKISGISIRLFGIDAPERKQICSIRNQSYNCGLKSTEFLQSFITGRKVECSYKNLDKYGRIIGKCISHFKSANSSKTEPIQLNWLMVRYGHAIEYKRYSKGEYFKAENLAKKEKRGIWRGKFDKPEDWRRKYK